MSSKPLRTIDIARHGGVSAATVRLYEQQGYLPPVSRASNGYRLFDERHLYHMEMIRQVMDFREIDEALYQNGLEMLKQAAQGNYLVALVIAEKLTDLLSQEKHQTEQAIQILKNGEGHHQVIAHPDHALSIGETAQLLNVSIADLRGWEDKGFLRVPRDNNGYRLYHIAEINRLLVIQLLHRVNYSKTAILSCLQRLDEFSLAPHSKTPLDTSSTAYQVAEFEIYAGETWLLTVQMLHTRAVRFCILLKSLADIA